MILWFRRYSNYKLSVYKADALPPLTFLHYAIRFETTHEDSMTNYK